MADVSLVDIKKNYGKKTVLQGVSLQADFGKCVGILGANGSGKSTLLSILAGIQKHDGGSFFCNGEDLFSNAKKRKQLVGYVPQGTPLMEELSARDNLLLWYTKQDMERELQGGVLSMLGIDQFLKVPVKQMSGGMKKRLSIGCAVAGTPKILLLDEPYAALDLACKDHIYQYLSEYKRQGGLIFLITHDAQSLSLCDEWYILKDGQVNPYLFDGDVHKLVECLE